jgi:hypothetical protein
MRSQPSGSVGDGFAAGFDDLVGDLIGDALVAAALVRSVAFSGAAEIVNHDAGAMLC